MKGVAIIANPSAGKDIRRLVASGRVISNQEKANIITRFVKGLAYKGVRNIYFMPDKSGLYRPCIDELKNDITDGATPASFEPSIDYVVTKIPRFTFEKFPQADATLTTQMKSVGEVMAIGRTFQESYQKAIRGLEIGKHGLEPINDLENS